MIFRTMLVEPKVNVFALLSWRSGFREFRFTMLVVFEYGLVSCLMQMEVNRDRQFEARNGVTWVRRF